jgi:hypothetical protein
MASHPSGNGSRHGIATPPVPRQRDRRGTSGRPTPPDLAEVAKEAVVSFLRDASTATAQREAGRTEAAGPGSVATAVMPAARPGAGVSDDQLAAQSTVLKAAAMSVATLDRIEAAAAKVEADIAEALRRHAELQAGAGAAAEKAVSAAQRAWVAAGTAEKAETKAKASLKLIARYVVVTSVLVAIELVIFVLFASSAH